MRGCEADFDGDDEDFDFLLDFDDEDVACFVATQHLDDKDVRGPKFLEIPAAAAGMSAMEITSFSIASLCIPSGSSNAKFVTEEPVLSPSKSLCSGMA